jgi:hypothetical protein
MHNEMSNHFLLYPFVFLTSLFSAFVAVLYFIDEWRLKNKKFLGSKWIPLAFLKQVSEAFIFLAFGILTLAIVLTWMGSVQQPFTYVMAVKMTVTLLIWLYFLIYLYLKLSKKFTGRWLMLFSLVGFILVSLMTSFCIWIK